MSETTTEYGRRFGRADLASAYLAVLVPKVFGPWAERLLDRAAPRPGEVVLDVACGPGTVARRAARRVGPTGAVTGADVSPAMIGEASNVPPDPDTAPLTWLVSPAAPLAVPDASFDLVTCQQGLQFFPDPAAALREAARALRPGGRIAVSTWAAGHAPIPAKALRARLTALGVEAAAMPPFGHTPADLAAALSGAGFRDVVVGAETLEVAWDSVEHVVAALSATALHELVEGLTAADREDALAVFRASLAPFLRPDGSVCYPTAGNLAVGFAAG